jgi:hypothetical protein
MSDDFRKNHACSGEAAATVSAPQWSRPSASSILERKASAEKPSNTTECEALGWARHAWSKSLFRVSRLAAANISDIVRAAPAS